MSTADSDGERSSRTAEHAARRTAEHRTAEHRTAEHATAEFAATGTRVTPLGSGSVRGGKPLGVRLYGVAALDHGGDGTPGSYASGTDLVTFRDLGAVVAPAPYSADVLGPNELDAHHAVVGEVFERRAIVPAPPGTVFRSRERLLGWLELHYYTLAEAIDFVTDRVVARVTVRRDDPNALATAALAVPPATLRLTLDVEGSASAPANDLVSLAADAFRELRREALAVLVLRASPEAAQPYEAAHGSFLIERGRWETFAEAVALQSRRHAALRLDCTGPWPPYDFVRMQFTA